MKHLKVGQYVKIVDGIREAYAEGHDGTWTTMLNTGVGQILRINEIITSSLSKNPKGVAREGYNCVDTDGLVYHGYPIECLQAVTKALPIGWFPILYKLS